MSTRTSAWFASAFLLLSAQLLLAFGTVVASSGVALASTTPDRYTVFGFYQPETFKGEQFVERMKEISSDVAGKAEVTLVDVSKPEAAVLMRQFNVYDVPYAVVVSPDGVVTGGVRGIPNTPDIVKSFISRGMAQIVRAIQGNKVVLIVVKGKDTVDDRTTRSSVEKIGRIFRKAAETVELDVSAPDDYETATTLGIDVTNTRALAVVVVNERGVLDQFSAPVSTKDLLESFQRVLASKSGCGGSNEGGLKSSCQN